MMNVEKTDSTLTLRFRRWGMEKFVFTLAALGTSVGPFALVMHWLHKPEPSQIVCERAAGDCKMNTGFAFGTQILDWPIAEMKKARVRTNARKQIEWVIDRTGGKLFYVAESDRDPAMQAEYEKNAAAMNAFFADAGQARFEAPVNEKHQRQYAPMLGFSVMWVLFFTMLHGWATTVTIDGKKGEVTVVKRPALWPRARRTFPLAQVAGAGARSSGIFLFAYVPLISFVLLDDHNRTLFKRRMMASPKKQKLVRADIDAVTAFIVSSRSAA